MAGAAGADLIVGGVPGEAAGVADGRGVDAERLPVEALGAPEAAEGEDGGLDAFGERGLKRGIEDLVSLGDGEGRLVAAGQGVFEFDHRLLLAAEEHEWGLLYI